MPAPTYPDRSQYKATLYNYLPPSLSEGEREVIAENMVQETWDLLKWVKMGPPRAAVGVDPVPGLLGGATTTLTIPLSGGTQGAALVSGDATVLGDITATLVSHSATEATVEVHKSGVLPLLAGRAWVFACSARDYIPLP